MSSISKNGNRDGDLRRGTCEKKSTPWQLKKKKTNICLILKRKCCRLPADCSNAFHPCIPPMLQFKAVILQVPAEGSNSSISWKRLRNADPSVPPLPANSETEDEAEQPVLSKPSKARSTLSNTVFSLPSNVSLTPKLPL